MRKISLLSALLILFLSNTYACDICSCSSGGSYYGILPQYQKHFIGVRWTGSSSTGSDIPSIIGEIAYPYPSAKLSLNTVELWGRFYLSKRIQMLAFVPFNFIKDTDKYLETTQINGTGDATLMANYAVVNTGDSMMRKVKHTLLVGGGVKLPTGKFRNMDDGRVSNPNMQTGTGSFDFILNAVYTLRYKKAGINTEASFRINTANRDHYRFGNRFNLSMKTFLWLKAGNASFLPNMGFAVEHADKNTRNNYRKYYTGGTAIYATMGMETYFKSFNIGFTFQQPVTYNLAEGLIKPSQRFTTNLTYMF